MFKHIKKYFSRKAKMYKVRKELFKNIENNDQEKVRESYQKLEKLL